MESRIQFRIGNETKKLAQQSAEREGVTLSDVCRRFVESLAEGQRKLGEHEQWLKTEVDTAFEKLAAGESQFLSRQKAKLRMEEKKAAIRSK
ncbi:MULTISPECIES: damage-inducible protein J [Photorhabdus]|uniref:damage-inducible protein J n=1 Tax=Photorhabdus TaxID=29487 RepID=UPI0006202789|nr:MULTISPECIES: damage-inducible protein J [Photorhabdus]MBS9428821.1 damage-inducible protein J [Photorhabdus akhurstii]MCC8458970.1 damage-inducible protein J [Photorhabdus aegyptia]